MLSNFKNNISNNLHNGVYNNRVYCLLGLVGNMEHVV